MAALFVLAALRGRSLPGEEVLPDLYSTFVQRPLLAATASKEGSGEQQVNKLRSQVASLEREARELRDQVAGRDRRLRPEWRSPMPYAAVFE